MGRGLGGKPRGGSGAVVGREATEGLMCGSGGEPRSASGAGSGGNLLGSL